MKNLPRDPYGHVRLSDLDVGDVVRGVVRQRLEALHIKATVVKKEIGYELRCAKPVAFDVEYTRTLGYGAVRYLLGGGSGAMVALRGGKVDARDVARDARSRHRSHPRAAGRHVDRSVRGGPQIHDTARKR